MIQHTGEAIVLRTWPFQEADLLVSLFTRDHGRLKGVARHAMRSRRRFGGALEPMTHVRATWTDKPRQPIDALVRLDAFEIVSSPLARPIDYARTAALELLAEILEELPEGAVDDPVFRLTLTVLDELTVGRTALPITYFCLWMNRLMGWMPDLAHCTACGVVLDSLPSAHSSSEPGLSLPGSPVTAWYSPTIDGLFCADDRRPNAHALPPATIALGRRIFRGPLQPLMSELSPNGALPATTPTTAILQRFALDILERNLDHRLRSAHALTRSPHPSSP